MAGGALVGSGGRFDEVELGVLPDPEAETDPVEAAKRKQGGA